MSRDYPCVYYYDNGKCKKFEDPGCTSYCVLGPCSHETPSNADRIRVMTDEELAAAFADAVYYGPTEKRCNDRNEAIQAWMDWLQQPCGGADCADRNS